MQRPILVTIFFITFFTGPGGGGGSEDGYILELCSKVE